MFGILFGDNFYYRLRSDEPITSVPYRTAIGRASGVHRVASLMRKRGVDVEVVDFFNSWTDEELATFVKKFRKIDFIGFGLGLSVLEKEKIDILISKVREINPSAKVIAGGQGILNNPHQGIDLFFKGFTEGAIDDIVKYLKTRRFNPLLVQKIKTHDVKTVVECTHNYPVYELTELNTEYLDGDFIDSNETLPIEFSRGCVFKCKFCNFPLVGKNKNDYIRDKEDVKQELIRNYTKWGTTRYIISDDTFNDNPLKVDMLHEIANELDFKLSLIIYCRVDLLRTYPDQLDKLVKSGVKSLYFGIESLNERSSKSINKGLTGDKLKDYLLEIKKRYPKLHINGSFIIGLPYEPIETFNDNIDWSLSAGVFDTYLFFPLNIPKDNKINDMSPFSSNYGDYGYDIMSDEEIEKFIESSPPEQQIRDLMNKHKYNDNYKHHYLPWKNEHMNFLTSLVYSENLVNKLESSTTLNGHMAMGMSFNQETVDIMLQTIKTNIDWNTQRNDAFAFIELYKKRKLAI